VISRAACVALVALALASAGLQPRPAAADDKALVDGMEAVRPDWLPSLDQCPADAMPPRETRSGFYKGRCESTLERCLRNCQSGNAEDCYASAIAVQKVSKHSPVAEALFLKACALGIASGCTNRAAGILFDHKADPCALRTFTAACDRLDPWACTMIGFHLVRGIGIEKDHERARQLLSRSCKYGDTDEACRAAKRLLEQLDE
jgi:hypothetical protein